MFAQEIKIAQTEHALFIAKFNQPAVEGMTVPVPNIIDRAMAAAKRLLTPARRPQTLRHASVTHNAPAR